MSYTMKIALVNVFYTKVNLTDHIGLGSITAYLRKNNVDVDLKFLEPDLINEDTIKEEYLSYDVYGFSLFTMNAKFVYEISSIIKKYNPKALIFAGGHLATIVPDFVLRDCPSIDFIVLGDGEYTTLDVIRQIERHEDLSSLPHVKTRNDTYEKKADVININELPFPARDNLLLSLKKGNAIAQISASRGCCSNCSFCSANCYYKKWRGRETEQVFQEIVHLNKNYNIRNFMFTDASLEDPGIEGKKRLRRLCNKLIEYPQKLAFRCFLRSETFSYGDIELIQLMRAAGFSQVFIGFESANDDDLRFYGKAAKASDNGRTIELFRKCDIEIILGFIMLNPISTPESVSQNYEFLKKYNSYTYGNYISKIELDYNTDMYKELKELDLLKSEYNYLNPFAYTYKNTTIRQISDFLNKKNNESSIMDCDGDYTAFVQIFNNLKILYPELARGYIEKFNHIKMEISEKLAEYFKIIYIDFDLEKAEKEWDSFYPFMISLYNKAKFLTISMIRNKQFRDILYNNL